MKKVFQSNSEICHYWANNEDATDGRANSLFFNNNQGFNNRDGKRQIYSYGYHYLLAEFIDKNTVLINNKGYSSSTGKHISIIIGATSQFKQFFTSLCDLKIVYNAVIWNQSKLVRANKPELYLQPIFRKFETLNEYLKYTKTLTKVKKTKEYKYILKTVNSLKNDYEATLQKAKERNAKEQKLEEIKLKMDIDKFKNNEINYFYSKIKKFDYLRISLDGANVETSQRVKIPVIEAKRLLKLIDEKNIISQRVDNKFIVNSFNGLLKVGCHNIPLSEINYIRGLI